MKPGEKNDKDAKARLMEAGGEVFAEKGFRGATVRDICRRAGVHVGAVNYHFRDKMGLYTAVIEYSFKVAMDKYPPDMGLGPGSGPEEKLEAFIHSLLLRLLAEGFPAWHGKLMAHEVMDPSPALAQVAEGSIRPLFEYLASILKDLLHDEVQPEGRVSDSMFLAATSIAGLCLYFYIGRHVVEVLRPGSIASIGIEGLAGHVTRFALGGLREMAVKGLGNGKRGL